MKINLQWAWDKVRELWYNPYYLWLYWSQNYNLDTENSDVDYKCIVLPNLKELVKNTNRTSTTIEFEWWQIDIKDIRVYVDSAVKVNVNFIEILNTPYFLWNPTIREYFTPLLNELGGQYLRSCLGMIAQKHHALEHPYPSKIEQIEKFWYDPKQLCHIVRLFILMQRYLKGVYNYIHDWEEKEMLLNIKSWVIPLQKAREMADEYYCKAKDLVTALSPKDSFETKRELIEFAQDEVISFINNN